MSNDCEHKHISLVETSIWMEDRYADEFVCDECGESLYQYFTKNGWEDSDGDEYDPDVLAAQIT